jgi:hypothetical protein
LSFVTFSLSEYYDEDILKYTCPKMTSPRPSPEGEGVFPYMFCTASWDLIVNLLKFMYSFIFLLVMDLQFLPLTGEGQDGVIYINHIHHSKYNRIMMTSP